MERPDQVDYLSGKTRVFGIVGDPIEQVRSPEMITAEMTGRGHDAVLVPMHVLPADFDALVPQLMRMRNLGGLVFTIPYKARACALASDLGPQARIVGAINALARGAQGRWRGEIFDGQGCVEAFRRRGIALRGKHVMLIGAGGAGSAIAAAVAFEAPASLTIHDADAARAHSLAAAVTRGSRARPSSIGPIRARSASMSRMRSAARGCERLARCRGLMASERRKAASASSRRPLRSKMRPSL